MCRFPLLAFFFLLVSVTELLVGGIYAICASSCSDSYGEPSTVLDFGDTAMNKTKAALPCSLYSIGGIQTVNQEKNTVACSRDTIL